MILSRRLALRGLAVGALLAPALARAARAEAGPIQIIKGELTQGGWLRGQAAVGLSLSLDDKPVAMDGTGLFLIAFDRDAAPSALLSGTSASGAKVSLPLTIAPRHWNIEQVDAPFHPPGLPDEEFARLRPAELARIAAARARDTGAQGWRQDFHWPIKARISGLFGAQRVYRGPDGKPQPGAYHAGIDIAGGAGSTYAAPADGTVVLAAEAPFTLEGHLLMLDHGMGLNSAFLHSSALLVKEGDRVSQGQPLGRIGMTGRATGPHLHWALRWHEAKLDPLLFTGPMA